MASLFPKIFDTFKRKKNRVVEIINNEPVVIEDGDDIMAEDINELQEAIESIQKNIGIDAQGNYKDIATRLNNIQNVDTIDIPSILLFKHNIALFNNISNIDDIIWELKQYKKVIIGFDSIDRFPIENSTAAIIVSNLKDHTDVYIYIDCKNKTKDNLISDILTTLQLKQFGIKGIMLDSFGYSETNFNRSTQNEIITIIKNNSLNVIVSCSVLEECLSANYHETYNPLYESINLHEGDAFMLQNAYTDESGTFRNLYNINRDMLKLCVKDVGYRTTLGIDVYVANTISVDEPKKQDTYFKFIALSVLYSVDGMAVATNYVSTAGYNKYDSMPIVANYKSKGIDIRAIDSGYERNLNNSKIVVYINNEGQLKYEFKNLKIPGSMIDTDSFAFDFSKIQISNIDASKIVGDISAENMSSNVIEAINSAPAEQKISQSKLDIVIDKNMIINAVKNIFKFFNYSKIDSGDMHVSSNAYFEKNVELNGENTVLAAPMINANKIITKELDVTSGVANIERIKAKAIDTSLIMPTNSLTMLSNMIEMATKKGYNKFIAKLIEDDHIGTGKKTLNELNTIEHSTEQILEIQQSGSEYVLNMSQYAGISSGFYVVYETDIQVDGIESETGYESKIINIKRIDTSQYIAIYHNGDLIKSIDETSAATTMQVTVKFTNGHNRLIFVVESHNGLDPSLFLLQNITEIYGTPPKYMFYEKIVKVDCFADQVTKISGNIIETGTIQANHIQAGSIDATKLSVQLKDDLNNMKTQLNVQSGLIELKADQTFVEQVAKNVTYKVDIISTNGGVFKNGQISTTLIARVYKGKTDITDTIDESKFTWRRVSENSEEDAIWNANHVGLKQITVTHEDVRQKATFFCDILE